MDRFYRPLPGQESKKALELSCRKKQAVTLSQLVFFIDE